MALKDTVNKLVNSVNNFFSKGQKADGNNYGIKSSATSIAAQPSYNKTPVTSVPNPPTASTTKTATPSKYDDAYYNKLDGNDFDLSSNGAFGSGKAATTTPVPTSYYDKLNRNGYVPSTPAPVQTPAATSAPAQTPTIPTYTDTQKNTQNYLGMLANGKYKAAFEGLSPQQLDMINGLYTNNNFLKDGAQYDIYDEYDLNDYEQDIRDYLTDRGMNASQINGIISGWYEQFGVDRGEFKKEQLVNKILGDQGMTQNQYKTAQNNALNEGVNAINNNYDKYSEEAMNRNAINSAAAQRLALKLANSGADSNTGMDLNNLANSQAALQTAQSAIDKDVEIAGQKYLKLADFISNNKVSNVKDLGAYLSTQQSNFAQVLGNYLYQNANGAVEWDIANLNAAQQKEINNMGINNAEAAINYITNNPNAPEDQKRLVLAGLGFSNETIDAIFKYYTDTAKKEQKQKGAEYNAAYKPSLGDLGTE